MEAATVPVENLDPPPAHRAIDAVIAEIDRGDNYRKTYDEAYLEELTASVAAHGVIQSIVLRPNTALPPGVVSPRWRLVAGECRIRASLAAGKTTIPATVRDDLDDASARVISLIENLQRKNVDPLEEADGFRELHETPNCWPVEKIAEQVGQKRGYVYARLKLCSLCDAGRKAYRDGKIDVSVAILIARIPSKEMQTKAATEIARSPVSYEQAARHVHNNFMLRLTGASFDIADEALLPAAGSCAKCPKRTGNQRELFADIKSADVCTDPPCYKKKSDAAWERTAADAEKKGHKIIDGKEADKLFPYNGQLSHTAPFVDLEEECYEDKKERPYKKLIAKDAPLVIARDPAGKVHQLIAKAELPAAMKGSGVKPHVERSATPDAEEAKRRKKLAKKHAIVRAAIGAIVAKIDNAGGVPGEKYWRAVVDELSRQGYANAIADVVKRRGWTVKKGARKGVVFEDQVAKLKASELPGLVLEVIITRNAYFSYASGMSEGVEVAARATGIDLRALEKRVGDAFTEGAKAKKKTAKKGGRK